MTEQPADPVGPDPVGSDPGRAVNSTRGPRWFEVLGAVGVGLAIGVVIFSFLGDDDDTATPSVLTPLTATTAASSTTSPTTEPINSTATSPPPSSPPPSSKAEPSPTISSTPAAPLLDAYRRSLDATYALDAELTRDRNGQITITSVRQANRDGRRLDEVGVVSVVIDGDTLRQCDRSSGVVLCTDPEPAASTEQRFELFTSLVGAEASLYDVFTADVDTLGDLTTPPPGSTALSCWTIVARVAGEGLNFGDEASFCFDDGTGALVSRHVRNGATEERFRTITLRSVVEDRDLDPSRF